MILKCLRIVYLVVCILAMPIYSDFNSLSEGVNPFNKFSSSNGGVNTFSGDAYFSFPMVKDAVLSYSSNIYINMKL